MDIQTLINTKPSRRSELPGWYGELFAAARESQTSIAQLAAQVGCSIPNLYFWRRRLRDHLPESPRTKAAPGLVRVALAKSEAPQEPGPRLEVRLSSGGSVLVPSGFNPEDLTAVLDVLGRC